MFAVQLKFIILTISTIILAGCNSMMPSKPKALHPFVSPQEVIVKKNLNLENGQAKEYVYVWDAARQHLEPQSLYPRTVLSQYCHEQGGKFSLLHRSRLSLVKENAQRSSLNKNRYVTQGIGAYQCHLSSQTQKNWIVSIEPVSERQQDKKGTRAVRLLTQMFTLNEAHNFYQANKTASKVRKPGNDKAEAKTTVKEVEKADLDKKETDKQENRVSLEQPAVVTRRKVETPQQQQMKLYVVARRDINSGKNLNNACNNAQRAYNYGKLQGTEGTRVYTESGMLVARCLNAIPAYANRFPNSKAQAKRMLQNLATNYNHSGAKNMLKQIN